MSHKSQLDLLSKSFGKQHVEDFWSHFEAKVPDLFVDEPQDTRVGVLEYAVSRDLRAWEKRKQYDVNPHYELVQNSEQLTSIITEKIVPGASRVLVVYRFNSWSPLDITFETFRVIWEHDQILLSFIKIVMGFAAKSFSGDEDFMACYSQTHTPHECDKGSRKPEDSFGDDSASISTEMDGTSTSSFCYNIRHMERHGRELQDPWSCRQTAIHQTIWHHSRTTRTILIQPPKSLDKSFTHGVSMNVSHPMNLHLRLLKTGLAEWREYLNYLSTNIKELDMHIAICKPYGEFGLDLSSKQRVHSLRRKLYHARSILSKMRAMIMKMKTHEQKTAKLCKLSLDTQELFQSDLSNILVEVENHLQTIRKLLSMTYDIKSMYTDIIHLASQDLIHQNAIKLSEIAEMDSRENKIMISISNKMYRDSRTMRIATVVAMLYLPANLVLSFFSTIFVWLDSNETSGAGADPTLRIQHQ